MTDSARETCIGYGRGAHAFDGGDGVGLPRPHAPLAQSLDMGNAPAYRIWPPVALGVPLVVGVLLSAADLDPVRLPVGVRAAGWALVAVFGAWNAWALAIMARHSTGLLPGQATTTLLERGPFRISRNPLYLGLITLALGLALLARSLWAVALLPVGILALWWGAIRPEERYLRSTFGSEYLAYQRRVHRWL